MDLHTHSHTPQDIFPDKFNIKKLTVFPFFGSRKLLYWLVWKSVVLPEVYHDKTMTNSTSDIVFHLKHVKYRSLFLKKDILCSFTRSQFYFGLLFIYFYMLKCSKYTSGFFYCLSLQHCICLCHERSVLAPVSLRPPPPHILYALIGQLTHAWASTAHCVSSLSSLELVFSFQLASCLLLKYRRWPRKCLTWWRRVMSISHRVKGSTTGINPNPNPLYGREELSSVHTLGFFTFKTFYPHKNLQFVTHWKNKIPS